MPDDFKSLVKNLTPEFAKFKVENRKEIMDTLTLRPFASCQRFCGKILNLINLN